MNIHDETMRLLNSRASQFAAKSSALSTLIEEVDLYFQQLPGKLPVHVEGIFEDILWELRFRRSGDDWQLTLHHENLPLEIKRDGGILVVNASIGIKSIAARMLPELMLRLANSIEERLGEVNEGLESLCKISFLAVDEEIAAQESKLISERPFTNFLAPNTREGG